MAKLFESDPIPVNEEYVRALQNEVARLRARNEHLEHCLSQTSFHTPVRRSMVQGAADAIIVADGDGTILFANARAAIFLGIDSELAQGASLKSLLGANDVFLRVFEFAVRSGLGIAIAEQREGRLYECRSMPVVVGSQLQIILAFVDISERDHTRQMMLQTQRVLEERIASRNAALHVQVQERLRAEEALRREQGFFRLVMDTDPSFISVYDQSGVPRLINKAFAALFGFDVDTPLDEVFYEGAPAWLFVGGNARNVCSLGEAVHQECELEDELGTFQWYDTVTTPLHMPSGEILALNIATDVTDRKVSQLALEQAHSELEERVKERTVALAELNGRLVREAMERIEAQRQTEESEARFKGLFYANQAIKLLIDQKTMIILEVNEAAAEYYGYAREEMAGMEFPLLTQSSPDLVRSRNENIACNGTARFESIHRHKDGTSLDVEFFAGTIMEKGRKVTFAIVHDISVRKRAERLVVEQRNHLTALMNAMGESALLLDMRGRIITLNTAAANIFQSTVENLVGSKLMSLLIPQARAEHLRMLDMVLTKGNPVRDEMAFADVLWDVTYYPVLEAQDQVVGVAVYAKDITARKKSEERMRWLSARVLSAQEEERKRIGRELHDSTAQTLSGIKFMVEADLAVMERAQVPHDTKVIRKVVSLMQGAIIELRRIIMDLRPTVLDDLGLLSALRWLQDEFSSMYGNINFRLWLDMDEECLDELQKSVLFRVAQEAITNVGRHSKADALSLSLSQEGGFCVLTISDNGVGFEEREMGFSGIGLDSMRERLELVDGHLYIVTEKGMGTQVQAVVPLMGMSD